VGGGVAESEPVAEPDAPRESEPEGVGVGDAVIEPVALGVAL
jgi:hypothetical protein